MKNSILFISFILITYPSLSQDRSVLLDDSTFIKTQEQAEVIETVSDLDPQRSALLSALFPGLGQVYNKQYWKVPIVIAGTIIFAHFIDYNNKVYHRLRNAAIITAAGEPNPYIGRINSQQRLVRNRDIFRRNRDFLIILGSAFYIIQIIDAHVSAHLNEFKINQNLTFKIKPSIQSIPLFLQATGGGSFILRF